MNLEALVEGECFPSGPGELPMGHGVSHSVELLRGTDLGSWRGEWVST